MAPWLACALKAVGLPVVVIGAWRVASALRMRPLKTGQKDARALAETLHSGCFTAVFATSEESHRIKALLSARDQLVRDKRSLFGQIRGLLRSFRIRLGKRRGSCMSRYVSINSEDAGNGGLDNFDAEADFKHVALYLVAQWKMMLGDAEHGAMVNDRGEQHQGFTGAVVSYTW